MERVPSLFSVLFLVRALTLRLQWCASAFILLPQIMHSRTLSPKSLLITIYAETQRHTPKR